MNLKTNKLQIKYNKAGLVNIKEKNATGLVKCVYDLEEEEIMNQIDQNYPNTEVELFKKDDEFTGTFKITFQNEQDLQKAIAEKFTLGHRKYTIEEFIHKPRVIKCNRCQKFGHVSRLCRSKDPVCGKCCLGHETKDCTTSPADYKCFHCKQTDHTTGSNNCDLMKEKYQILSNRQDV